MRQMGVLIDKGRPACPPRPVPFEIPAPPPIGPALNHPLVPKELSACCTRVLQARGQAVGQSQPFRSRARPAIRLPKTAGRRQNGRPQPCPEPVTDPAETA